MPRRTRRSVEPAGTVGHKTHSRNPAAGNGRSNGTRYSDAQKLTAVTAMYAANFQHPFSDDGLAAARAVLGINVPISTLKNWSDIYSERVIALMARPTDEQIVKGTQTAVMEHLFGIRDKLLEHLDNVDTVKAADFQRASVALGVVLDKIDQQAGIAPDTLIIVKQLSALFESAQWDVNLFLSDMLESTRIRLGLQQPRFTASLPALPATTDGDTVDAT